jgi:hypothetical protein
VKGRPFIEGINLMPLHHAGLQSTWVAGVNLPLKKHSAQRPSFYFRLITDAAGKRPQGHFTKDGIF